MKELKFRLTTLEDVKANISTLLPSPLALDVETNGFYGKIRLAQFYQEEWPEALLVEYPEIIELSALLANQHIVCHNTSYEVSTIQTQMGELFGQPNYPWQPAGWDDTLLLSKLQWFTREKYTLDECYKHAFNIDPYEAHGLDKKAMQAAWGSNSPVTQDMLTYAALDVFYLLELYDKCKSWKNSTVYSLDHTATTIAFQFQCNGLPYSEERIDKLIAENNAKIDQINLPINCNSWQQVRPYIGEDESNGLALSIFASEGNQKAADVQTTRRLMKQNSFLTKYLAESFENRIYGKFTFTTKSGRGNCKDQNLQQLPRKTKCVFEAQENNVFVMADYGQLELRYACALTGEMNMARLFHQGADLHQATADMMTVPRQQAKTCNFNLLYGGSANMLRNIFIEQADLLLPIEQVRTLKKDWHKLWPTLTKWQNDMTDTWRAGEYQQTTLGRKFKSKLYTDAMNLPIQGGSAEIAKLALHKMHKAVKANTHLCNSVAMCNFVHDSFHWECPNDPAYYEPLALIIANAMKEAWIDLVQHTKFPDLPMPVDILVGKNWGDVESEKETPIYKLALK